MNSALIQIPANAMFATNELIDLRHKCRKRFELDFMICRLGATRKMGDLDSNADDVELAAAYSL